MSCSSDMCGFKTVNQLNESYCGKPVLWNSKNKYYFIKKKKKKLCMGWTFKFIFVWYRHNKREHKISNRWIIKIEKKQ